MPVTKCSNGKYKIGSGECTYNSKEKAEAAYKGYIAQKNMNEMKYEISSIEEDFKIIGLELTKQRKIIEEVNRSDSNK